jgi:hypothetical protein
MIDFKINFKNQYCNSLYSKNNENVTKITIFLVKIVTEKHLRKTYGV